MINIITIIYCLISNNKTVKSSKKHHLVKIKLFKMSNFQVSILKLEIWRLSLIKFLNNLSEIYNHHKKFKMFKWEKIFNILENFKLKIILREFRYNHNLKITIINLMINKSICKSFLTNLIKINNHHIYLSCKIVWLIKKKLNLKTFMIIKKLYQIFRNIQNKAHLNYLIFLLMKSSKKKI
jgi:hypothetical protein